MIKTIIYTNASWDTITTQMKNRIAHTLGKGRNASALVYPTSPSAIPEIHKKTRDIYIISNCGLLCIKRLLNFCVRV